MRSSRNLFFAFLGGMATGALIAVGVMKKKGYFPSSDDTDGEEPTKNPAGEISGKESDNIPKKDSPSFSMGKTIDTHRTSYNSVSKPELDSLAKKYQDENNTDSIVKDDDQNMEEEAGYEDEDEDEYGFVPPGKDAMELEIIDSVDYGKFILPLPAHRDKKIFLIRAEDFGELYPTEILTYYERDNVLCDENDAVIEDPIAVVGAALQFFGESGDEPDTVYVRNASYALEYEVVRVDGYFGAHIYGISDEEMEGGGMAFIPKKTTKRRVDKDDE